MKKKQQPFSFVILPFLSDLFLLKVANIIWCISVIRCIVKELDRSIAGTGGGWQSARMRVATFPAQGDCYDSSRKCGATTLLRLTLTRQQQKTNGKASTSVFSFIPKTNPSTWNSSTRRNTRSRSEKLRARRSDESIPTGCP